MSDTLSNGADGPVVETYETLFTPKAEEPPQVPAQEASEQIDDEAKDGGNNEEPEDTPASDGEQDDPIEKAKAKTPKGVQKRLDELTKQREDFRRQAEAATRALEEVAKRVGGQQPETVAQDDGRPRMDQFEDVSDYIDALTDWKMHRAETLRIQQEKISRIEKMEANVRAKHADYDEVLGNFLNSPLARNPVMLDVIQTSDKAAELVHKIGSDPDIAKELQGLSPYRLAAKLAAMEDALEEKPRPDKPVSKAPPPPGKIAGAPPVVDPMKIETPHASESDMDARINAVRKSYIDRGLKPPY